jgi:1-acyl-sn-glycerol-3-phosphate acyltransferase
MSEEPTLQLDVGKSLAYRVVAGLIVVLSKILFRPRVTGAENIPLTGPVLIAPIHRSNVDFAFTLFISPRKVFFMAKDPLFKVPLFGTLLRRLGAFPVHRGAADRESITLSEEVLRQGHALVLGPCSLRRAPRPWWCPSALVAVTGPCPTGPEFRARRGCALSWGHQSVRRYQKAASRDHPSPPRVKNFVKNSRRSTAKALKAN